MQVFERALRRAGLAVAHTQGFNPRPKLTFALALPLGVESLDEVVDVDLVESHPEADVLKRFAAECPEGLTINACQALDDRASPQVVSCSYQVEIPEEFHKTLSNGVERFEASEDATITRERKGKTREIQLKDYVESVAWNEANLTFRLRQSNQGGLKPFELLEWLGVDPFELKVLKTATQLASA